MTCRDWFQLSLKEGLTVFRDQEFSADQRSRPVQRIGDVRALRARQFAEDSGPLAHPVQPKSYIEINNFYTSTVYEKGAELVRMIHTLIGPRAFRGGMDLRDEVAGTEGTIWLNHWLRTGSEMFTAVGQGGYVAEKAEGDKGWQFPVGDEVAELGYIDGIIMPENTRYQICRALDMLEHKADSNPPKKHGCIPL